MQTKDLFHIFHLFVLNHYGENKTYKNNKNARADITPESGTRAEHKNAIKEKFSSKLIFIFLQWKFLIKTKSFWRKDHKTTKRRSRCLCVSISCIRCSKFFMKLLLVSLCALTLMTTRTTIQHLLHYIIKVKINRENLI